MRFVDNSPERDVIQKNKTPANRSGSAGPSKVVGFRTAAAKVLLEPPFGRILPSWTGSVNVVFWPTAAHRRLAVYVCLGFLCGRSAVCPETAGTDPQRT